MRFVDLLFVRMLGVSDDDVDVWYCTINVSVWHEFSHTPIAIWPVGLGRTYFDIPKSHRFIELAKRLHRCRTSRSSRIHESSWRPPQPKSRLRLCWHNRYMTCNNRWCRKAYDRIVCMVPQSECCQPMGAGMIWNSCKTQSEFGVSNLSFQHRCSHKTLWCSNFRYVLC